MIEKKALDKWEMGYKSDTDYNNGRKEIFNKAIDQQGERQIGHNREKLIKRLWDVDMKPLPYDRADEEEKEIYYKYADSIIQSESQLIEFKE